MMKRITGNNRILTAFKSNDYTTIENIIKNKEFLQSPLNFSLKEKNYDLYRYLIDNHSDKIKPDINRNFLLDIPNYETLKITQKTYGENFINDLFSHTRIETKKKDDSDISIVFFFVTCYLIVCLHR